MMSLWRITRGIGGSAALVFAVGACHSLEVENPNAPDNQKLLADPGGVEAVTAGTMRGWFNAWESFKGSGPPVTMARTFTSSWNNAHMRYYSGIDNPGDPATTGYTPTATWTRGVNFGTWMNDPARDERVEVEAPWGGGEDEWLAVPKVWPGYYAGMSAASDVLNVIRNNSFVVRDAGDTKRAETIAELGRGLALMGIALNFDKGYIIDENTDLASLSYSDRKAMRDAAVASFQTVITDATATSFSTPASWTNGKVYTNVQIAQVANTMAALTLAYYPRDDAEATSQVNWATVASFAAAGLSSGTPVNWESVGDGCTAWCPELLGWFDEIGTGRVSTRVSSFLDPATQQDPWPLAGNPQPNSADKRLGDGSFGTGSLSGGATTPVKTANAGTDFAWSPRAIFRPDRGAHNQSNIAFIRYDLTGNEDADGIVGVKGPWTAVGATVNDLIWAEALLRQGGAANVLLAAQKINRTRVTRGGLSDATLAVGNVGAPTDGPCTATGVLAKSGAGPCTLWSMLLYEAELELLGQGSLPYFNQRKLPFVATCGLTAPCSGRHIQGLLPGTPRERPVPVKELDIKAEAHYTFGGAVTKSTPP
jgi:starch-binding outer membrane protein, SusD/RagB family